MATAQGAASIVEMTDVPRARRDAPADLLVVIGGLAAAAVGLGIQWVANPATFASFGFPPGLIYVVGTAVIVWCNRRSPWAAAGGVTMGVWILLGGLVGGELQENLATGNAGTVTGNLVMSAGLALSVVAGVISVVRARRTRPRPEFPPVSARHPRRIAAIVAICGLLLDSIGDAAPEGFRWDGLGPLLFLALAVAVAATPGPVMLQMAVLICFSFVGGALSSAEFMGRLNGPVTDLLFLGAAMQMVGLTLTLLVGLYAAFPVGRAGRRVIGRLRV